MQGRNNNGKYYIHLLTTQDKQTLHQQHYKFIREEYYTRENEDFVTFIGFVFVFEV